MIDIITLNLYIEWIIIILVVVYNLRQQRNLMPIGNVNQSEFLFVIFIGIIFIVLFGFRDYTSSIAGDSWLYEYSYQNCVPLSAITNLDFKGEWLWELIMMACREVGFSSTEWFVLIAAIYIVPVIIGCRIISPNSPLTPFVFFIASFLFTTNGINGIRNADGCSLVFWAICIIIQSPKLKTLLLTSPLLIAAYCIHQSTIMLTLPLITSIYVIKNTKIAVFIWGLTIILSLLFGNHLANAIALFSDNDRAIGYINAGDSGRIMQAFSKSGFRWDFLLYSALPIVVGWIITIKQGVTDQGYKILLNTYILSNAIWVVFIYAAYSNRFAMLSWFLYPFVLAIPFTRMKLTPNLLYYSKIILWIEFGTTIILRNL